MRGNIILSAIFIKQTLVSRHTKTKQGFITGNLKTGFPAESITDPDNFISLLFYFGMVTIGGLYEGEIKLIIPNQVVREQLFNYVHQ